MAMELPQIELDDVVVKQNKDNMYEVTVKWTNTGKLPVALEQAKLVKIVQEDRIQLNFDNDLTKGFEDAKVKILTPSTFNKTIKAGYTKAGESKSASFEIELNGIDGAKATLKILSTRGGYIEKEVIIGTPEQDSEEK